MKVAIVHDYIKEYGGAEKVLLALHKAFPKAPIYTTVYLPSYLGPNSEKFEKMNIRTSFLQYFPFKAKLISPMRLLSPFAFKSFDLSDYDVVIVSQTGAYFPNVIKKGKSKQITYTHTPPRYLYGYKTARDWTKNKFIFLLAHIANHFLRMIDFKSSQNVDQFISNSEEVKKRIEKFYRKDAKVIYPPVIDSIKYKVSSIKEKKEDYYLTGGRLARAKGIDVIIKAFNNNGKKLKIFGKGFAGFEKELSISARKNIEFVGEVTDEEKFELIRGAKAFIFASYDEDFGITPVESMSLGTPVIAYKSGGVKETVREGVGGLFYDTNNADELNKAIEKFEKKKFDSKKIKKNVEKFSEEEFIKKIKKEVEKYA